MISDEVGFDLSASAGRFEATGKVATRLKTMSAWAGRATPQARAAANSARLVLARPALIDVIFFSPFVLSDSRYAHEDFSQMTVAPPAECRRGKAVAPAAKYF